MKKALFLIVTLSLAYNVLIYAQEQWMRFTTKDGLLHTRVLSVAIDSIGDKWFGTSGGVVFYGNPNSLTTGIISKDKIISEQIFLYDNYPDPFNSETIIKYQIYKGSRVRLTIYNSSGQIVNILVNEFKQPGIYSITWNGTDENGSVVSSGLYLCKLAVKNKVKTGKIIFLK